jgi:hypothetical protein
MNTMKNRSDRVFYPDARVKGVREFFDIVQQDRDCMPSLISKETFKTLGIAPSHESNAISAIKFLGIIDKNGVPTEEFYSLRQDFINTLAKLVKTSYTKLFNNIPIRLMSQKTLVNFFVQQGYSEETAEYQAMLFVSLCHDAKINLPNVEKAFKRARFDKSV